MKSLGLFYATTSGRTKRVAELLAQELSWAQVSVQNVAESKPTDLLQYEALVLGSPTYGQGELHHHWLRWEAEVEALDLFGRAVALFGLGDQRYHGRTFAGALAHLDRLVRSAGANPVGCWSSVGYKFEVSPAVRNDGMFPGLVLDEINQRALTHERVRDWGALLQSEMLSELQVNPEEIYGKGRADV